MQRYGFHGLSYEYIASVLPEVAPEIAERRVIVAHLGSGASLCAMKQRKSVDSTLGFTALDGLCMGTRPGALDPGVVLYLFQGLGLSAQGGRDDALQEVGPARHLRHQQRHARAARRAASPTHASRVDYFVYRAAKEIGALAAVLGGIDGLVFTAGIGENSAGDPRAHLRGLRAGSASSSTRTRTRARGPRISTAASRVSAWVIPTNEELMIARHTGALLGIAGPRA